MDCTLSLARSFLHEKNIELKEKKRAGKNEQKNETVVVEYSSI